MSNHYESLFEFFIVLFLNVPANLCVLVFRLNLISRRGKFKILTYISITVAGMGGRGLDAKLRPWQNINIYNNFIYDTRLQHPRCDHSFPVQIREIDTMPKIFHFHCSRCYPLVLDPFLRRSEYSSRLSRT